MFKNTIIGYVPVSGSTHVPSNFALSGNVALVAGEGIRIDASTIEPNFRIEMAPDRIFEIYYTSKNGKKTLVFSEDIAHGIESREHMLDNEYRCHGTVDEI